MDVVNYAQENAKSHVCYSNDNRHLHLVTVDEEQLVVGDLPNLKEETISSIQVLLVSDCKIL